MASPPRLITIPLSHFCEKARWALDRAGIEYREEPHLPLVHRLHTTRVGCRSVPVLVVESQAIRDSHSILQWAAAHGSDGRLYPADEGLRARVIATERHADRELGPHVRRWAYSYLLAAPLLLLPCFSRRVTQFERLIACHPSTRSRRRCARTSSGFAPIGPAHSFFNYTHGNEAENFQPISWPVAIEA